MGLVVPVMFGVRRVGVYRLSVRQVGMYQIGVCRVSQGRPDVPTCCCHTCENTGQYGIPNETVIFSRVLIFQCEFLLRLCRMKQTASAKQPSTGAKSSLMHCVNSRRGAKFRWGRPSALGLRLALVQAAALDLRVGCFFVLKNPFWAACLICMTACSALVARISAALARFSVTVNCFVAVAIRDSARFNSF
jgi:hypothetical protein